jgi:hypothetical protein
MSQGFQQSNPESTPYQRIKVFTIQTSNWLQGQDLNLRSFGYEPNELPGYSTLRQKSVPVTQQQK